MLKSNKEVEHCLKQLLNLGKRNQGYITFKSINHLIAKHLAGITMDTIDWIYQNLSTAQIEIVDQLPGGIKTTVETQPFKQRYQLHRRKKTEKLYSRTHYKPNKGKRKVLDDNCLCPEKGIDQLLCQWEKTGELTGAHFFSVVEKCGLSHREIEQLAGYLGSQGVDYPEDYERYFSKVELFGGKEASLL